MADEILVQHAQSANQFQILLNGDVVGHIAYTDTGSQRAMVHTEVDPAHQGRGLATRLIGEALRITKEQGLTTIPVCPAIKAYVRKHPSAI
ncbi:MAG: GNAT family N-acetyltransferase [Beutenbergiaceae bacterium]